ncbi:MAG: class I SAM-dependent methyltransferase [Myxococcota bacterium]|jgi:SAM-dependent methyltransferase|nr:class I SAM-dependent methyltransferase [Myxococcota bacterium]
MKRRRLFRAAQAQSSLHAAYQRHGVVPYYRQHGSAYRNPHEPIIRAIVQDFARQSPWSGSILDLACGSGEVTLALLELGVKEVLGVDPFTAEAYSERTGMQAQELSFEDIAQGALEQHRFGMIICSFALHLIEESWLPRLCWALATLSPRMLILSPHKRPRLEEEWGWVLTEAWVEQRVHAREYRVGTRSEERGTRME